MVLVMSIGLVVLQQGKTQLGFVSFLVIIVSCGVRKNNQQCHTQVQKLNIDQWPS